MQQLFARRKPGRQAGDFRLVEQKNAVALDKLAAGRRLHILEAIGPRRTRVDYQMRIDIGGSVPRFIANYVTQDMPIATLSSLRRQVDRTAGEYGEFVAAWESRGD